MFLSDAFDMALTWFVYNSYARYPGDPFYWPEGGLEHAKQMRNIVKEEIIDFYFRKSFFYVAKDMLKWYLVDKGWIPNRSGIKKRLVLLTRPGRDEHTVQEMDIYSPTVENIEEKRPVVVFFYGGAWNAGRKEVYRTLGYNLASENYVVCVPNYIQAYFAGKCNHKVCSHGTIDDMKMDILRALKWVKENIIHYNGDPNNIVIVGHSAGAHLTTLALCSSDIGKYFNGLILLNGIFEIQEQFEHDSNRQVEKLCGLKRATGGGAPESLKIISPIHLITETTAFPPTILISAGKDIHVSKLQSERFHAKLSQCNAKSWIHFCPDSNHFSFLFAIMSKSYVTKLQKTEHKSLLFNSLHQFANKKEIEHDLLTSNYDDLSSI